MAAETRAVRRGHICNSLASFIRVYDRPGFFSFKWAALDIAIIALIMVVIAK